MPILRVPDFDKREVHEDELWVHSECYLFYAQQRRLHCTYMQLMDLWLRVPYCETCIRSDPFAFNQEPDIVPADWELGLLCVGEDVLHHTQMRLLQGPDYALMCKKCSASLRPWGGDNVYVVDHPVEEHYGIPLETPGTRRPPDWMRSMIIYLYDGKCFNCPLDDKSLLHIDHIRPQSRGGDAAFRNLQPLCERCGNEKTNAKPTEVTVYSTIYFGPLPSDGYEGLFW